MADETSPSEKAIEDNDFGSGGSGEANRSSHSTANLPDFLFLAERSDEMIVAFDSAFCYTYVNPAAEALIGPRETVLGRNLWEVSPQTEGTVYAQQYRRSMRERAIIEFEEFYPPRRRRNRVRCVPTPDGGLILQARDVTGQHEEEQRRAFLAELSERVRNLTDPDAVVIETVRRTGEFFEASRCTYAEADESAATLTVRQDWTRSDLPAITGAFPIGEADTFVVSSLRSALPLVSADIETDPRFSEAERRQLIEVGTRALINIPIRRNGRLAGTMTVHDFQPRFWSEQQVILLDQIAERTWQAVERASLLRHLEQSEARQRRIAETLIRSLLVTPAPNAFPGLEVCAYYEAASRDAQVGGDAYDFVRLADGRIGLCVFDVTGHGTDAALFFADIKYSLRIYLRETGGDTALALGRLNDHLLDGQRLDGHPPDVFVCAIVAVLDPTSGELNVSIAGMESPLLFRSATGRTEPLRSPGGLLLGALPDWRGDTVRTFLGVGDVLLCYTDGISEARSDPDLGLFGEQGIIRALAGSLPSAPLERVAAAVVESARAFANGVTSDDISLLAVRRTPYPQTGDTENP
ncbi:MAG: SpoIIE family protein phosphatase [Capsulimonadales bacterium]|nr:SpoIIE family protein phosphatase [Capsulimonadales bacterium]